MLLRLITRLVLLLVLGVLASGVVSARIQDRVRPPAASAEKLASWGDHPETAVLRQAAAMQAAETQQAASSLGYDFASGCCLAPENAAPEIYKASLRTKMTPRNTPQDLYEIANTGPKNYLLEGGGAQFWADGVVGATIQESKFVINAKSSPFIPGSSAPDFIRQKIVGVVDDEFARMAKIIADPSNPLRDVEVIVSDPAANPFFIDLMKKHGLNGRIINR